MFFKDDVAYTENAERIGEFPLDSDNTLYENYIEQISGESADLILRKTAVAERKVSVLLFDGISSNELVSRLLFSAIDSLNQRGGNTENTAEELKKLSLAQEQKPVKTYYDALLFAMSGFAVVKVDGDTEAWAYGYQDYPSRGVDEPKTETALFGSREGFTESIVANTGLVRLKLKSPLLQVKSVTVGSLGNTKVNIMYIKNTAPDSLVNEITEKLKSIDIDVLFSADALTPFLLDGRFSLFSRVGRTERPDVFAAKLSEGRIGIIADGCPFGITLPFLFLENFQTTDDYIERPYYTLFIRTLKFISFFCTILLPGYFVAVVSHHPHLLPGEMFAEIVDSVGKTPMSTMDEALLVFIMFEVLKEAGLRLPRPIGHTMGIVGGIVIGDAAVKAGIIGLPMIILIGFTAIAAFMIPSLSVPVTFLRFIFILAGGFMGLAGIAAVLSVTVILICGAEAFGVPLTSPIAPFDKKSLRDIFMRHSWKNLSEKVFRAPYSAGSTRKGGRQY